MNKLKKLTGVHTHVFVSVSLVKVGPVRKTRLQSVSSEVSL